MTIWQPRERSKFLKSVGSADDPVALDWMDSHPRELEHIDFTRMPASIRTGDYLVYYAAVHQKLYGLVEVFSPPEFDAQRKRWPYHAAVRPRLIVRDMNRAPSIDVLNVPGERNFRRTVQQRDYAILTEAEYERARDAIGRVIDESLGDVRDPRFNADQ
jgi:hypothetical protein